MLLAIELVWLWRARRWPLVDTLSMLLPGACMVAALRAALVGAPWPWLALALTASLPAHVWDMRRRERRIRISSSDRR